MSLSEIADGCAAIQSLVRECRGRADPRDIAQVDTVITELKRRVSVDPRLLSTPLPDPVAPPPSPSPSVPIVTRPSPSSFRPMSKKSAAFFPHLLRHSRWKRKGSPSEPPATQQRQRPVMYLSSCVDEPPRGMTTTSSDQYLDEPQEEEFLSACED